MKETARSREKEGEREKRPRAAVGVGRRRGFRRSRGQVRRERVAPLVMRERETRAFLVLGEKKSTEVVLKEVGPVFLTFTQSTAQFHYRIRQLRMLFARPPAAKISHLKITLSLSLYREREMYISRRLRDPLSLR